MQTQGACVKCKHYNKCYLTAIFRGDKLFLLNVQHTILLNVVSLLNLQARMLFVQTHYTLATEEAERIGVDHVARLSNTGTVDTSTGFI